jgi:beta-xylosidase
MKAKFVLCAVVISVILALGPFVYGSAESSLYPGSVAYSHVWLDDFASSSLDSLWSWVREDDTHWSLTDNPGFLRITTQTGGVVGPPNDQNNLLLTSAPSGDFQITTRVSIAPTQNFQFAALQVYQDDDNYVQINRAYANGDTVNFDLEVGGVITNVQVAVANTTLYLRIAREGDTYTGYYSTNGSTWTQVGQHTASLTHPAVGVSAGNNLSGVPEIPADFDYFQLESDFPAFDYTFADDFGSSWLHPLWSWVREDGTHWSLTDNPGFLRITTQTGGVVGSSNDQNNLLLTSAPAGDFQITTKATITPTQNFQFAALQVYQDDDNYVQINRAYANGDTVNFDLEVAGVITNVQVVVPDTTLYLRITRAGDTYTGYYSTDGSVWTQVGQHTVNLTNPAVGVGAGNNLPGVPEIPADFDFFQLEGNFPALAPRFSDGFQSTMLDSSWSWINENASQWSLTANPGFLRIMTHAGVVGDENLLVQAPPVGSFGITTRVVFTPTSNFQIAGLVIRQDADNTMLLGRAYCDLTPPVCVGNGIYFDYVEAGSFVENFSTATNWQGEAYLRVVREGGTYSGYYSENSAHWVLVGRHTPTGTFAPSVIGVTAAQGLPAIPADFDYFRLDANYHDFLPLVLRNQ